MIIESHHYPQESQSKSKSTNAKTISSATTLTRNGVVSLGSCVVVLNRQFLLLSHVPSFIIINFSFVDCAQTKMLTSFCILNEILKRPNTLGSVLIIIQIYRQVRLILIYLLKL